MIDYGLIDRASTFYEKHGYQRIESPWLVSKGIAEITKPRGRPHYIVRRETQDMEKSFVASGEQSFLYLINKGFLPATGKFQTITPCIRPDPFDDTHTKYFMKLELIEYNIHRDVDEKDLKSMMTHVHNFFVWEGAKPMKLEQLDGSFDIVHNGVELGSYGIRKTSFVSWVYGTGVAEPRFSRTIKNG